VTLTRRTTNSAPARLPSIILWCAFAALVALTLNNLATAAFPFTAIDEHGHLSYTLHLINTHRWCPDFSQFPMVDVATNKALHTPNYINHPPMFYWFMKLAHVAIPSLHPIQFRLFSLALSLLAMWLYTRFGTRLGLSVGGSILYALFPFMLYLQLQMGFYSNDAMALLGGVITNYASLHWLKGERPHRSIFWMGAGVLLASVKLTALLLVGLYALFCLGLRAQQVRVLPRRFFLFGVFIAAISAAPFVYFLLTFGSPAPTTLGQLAQLKACLHCNHAPMEFFAWLGFFISQFANQLSVPEATFFPILAYAAALLALFWPRMNQPSSPMRAMAIASAAATLITLGIHATFSWQRYHEYGWIFDSLVRYYLPLIGAYAAITCHALNPRTMMPDETP